MFCYKCGAENKNDATFCSKCGTAIGTSGSLPSPQTNHEPLEKYRLPEISDAIFDSLTQEQQRSYNRKVLAKSEYNLAKENYDTSMSLVGPLICIICGLLLAILEIYLSILVIIGIIWAFYRVASRSQAYQRLKDTEAELKAAIDADASQARMISQTPSVPCTFDKDFWKNITVIIIVLAALFTIVFLMMLYAQGKLS
ncbi:MAG: zinc-ribbon domain-containing protein [Methanoregula sp.]